MSEGTKLRDLVELSKADIEKALVEQAKDDGGVAKALGHLKGLAASVGAGKLNQALDTDIYELLAQAWAKVQAVRESAAKSRGTPGQTTVVTLSQHDFTHTCHPTLTFSVADMPLPELKLTLELVATFKGVALSIEDARLRALAPGEASVTVRLKYKSVTLWEKPTPAWKLPGEIHLGAGVPVV
jgi:hypothetical protein